MTAPQSAPKTEAVQDWWERNPFTLGLSEKKTDLVGRVDTEKMDVAYFAEIERKFRKHTRGGAQQDGKPLLSMLIDYPSLRGKKVLDIAVGSGWSLATFLEQGADATGIDLTDFAVEQTRRNLALRGLKADVLRMDAQRMTFPDATFDFVNAWGCVMHMPDTEGALREIRRVLKPGGRMLAYMYNRSSWPFWFNYFFLRGILKGDLIRYKFDLDKLTSRYSDGFSVGGNTLARFYTPAAAKRMYERAGFKDVKAWPWELPEEPDGWPAGKFPVFRHLPKSWKAWMAKRWGYGLIVTAAK